MTTINEVISELRSLSNPRAVEGMTRFGISPEKTLGVQIPDLRRTAKEITKDHALALKLWDTEIHEARILASMVDDPKLVDEVQMEKWVAEFDSWDICDQCIMNLFEDTELCWQKAVEWSRAKGEFIKRAGFVMMARLAFSDKKAKDEQFLPFLPLIRREATDDRNFVKKAINWALRQIGKRNANLCEIAIETAREILLLDSKVAKWIASDAIRELVDKQKRMSNAG